MKYYKTNYNSETGKKFQVLFEKIREGQRRRAEFRDKYKATNYLSREETWGIGCSLIGLKFGIEPPDSKQFRKTYGEGYEYWVPNKRTKLGKKIQEEMEQTKNSIPYKEVNACIGWDATMARIGIVWNENEVAFKIPSLKGGLGIDSEPETIPDDCVEILASEYERINETKGKQ